MSDGAQRGGGLATAVGELAPAGVAALVPLFEEGRRSGVLHVTDPSGRRGAVWFRDGRVVDAEAGRRTGEPAFHEVARWGEGTWRIALEPVERRRAIDLGTRALLAESARRAEELARLAARLPDPARALEIDYRLLSERLADIPDDVNGVLKLVDGRRTLADVLADAEADRLVAAEALVRLHADGVVRVSLRPPAPHGATGVDWFAGPRGGEAPPPGDGPDRAPRIVRFPARAREPALTPALPLEAVSPPRPAAAPEPAAPPEPPAASAGEPPPEQDDRPAPPPAPAPPRPAARRARWGRRSARRAWAIGVAAGVALGTVVGAGAVAWRRAPAADAVPGASPADAEYAGRLDAAHRKYLAGNFVAAVGEYRSALSVRETSAAFFGLGRALAAARQPALAVDALERAVALDGLNADAYIALGQVYAAENRPADARRAFARYLELSPAGEQASDVRAQLARLGGRSD